MLACAPFPVLRCPRLVGRRPDLVNPVERPRSAHVDVVRTSPWTSPTCAPSLAPVPVGEACATGLHCRGMRHDTSAIVMSAGTGSGNYELTAIDAALGAAGVANFNLLEVTSIVPPGVAVKVRRSQANVSGHGIILPAILAKLSTSDPTVSLAAAVGAGVAADDEQSGVLFRCVGEMTDEAAREAVEAMIAEGMAHRGVTDYRVHTASASAAATGTHQYRAVVALAALCDPTTLRVLGQ